MTKVICLTGGIGSGKTTVANMFSAHGIPVYIADDAAKAILDKDETRILLAKEFGQEIIQGEFVNRKKLAEIVFSNPEKLAILNTIIHPAVKADFEGWLQSHRHFPAILREAAILFESGAYRDCDVIITVTAPLETRIDRVAKRDSASRESILKRIENQWTDEQRIAKSDYVITNFSLEDTEQQVSKILKKLHIF